MPKRGNSGKVSQAPNWNQIYLKLQRHYPTVEAFAHQNFQHVPLCLIEEAIIGIKNEHLDIMDELGQLTSLLGLSLQPNKVDDIPGFLRALNPYELEKVIDSGLKIMSPESAKTIAKMMKLGNLPEYVKEYIDLSMVDAIAKRLT